MKKHPFPDAEVNESAGSLSGRFKLDLSRIRQCQAGRLRGFVFVQKKIIGVGEGGRHEGGEAVAVFTDEVYGRPKTQRLSLFQQVRRLGATLVVVLV